MGFIFWEKSTRYFEGVIPQLPKSIKKVGVFVNASLEEILNKIKVHDLQTVQLHGHESVEFCESLKKNTVNMIEIIKVFSVLDTIDFSILIPFESACDFFLFDTKGKLPGGNGTTFDWKVLENYSSTKPFFLSGGIGIEELEQVKQVLKSDLPLHAIDINSKFEVRPGLKKTALLNSFLFDLKQ
jgi:phosphoribosylanthranilate isomerase